MIRKSGKVLEGIKCSGVHHSTKCRVPFSHVLCSCWEFLFTFGGS